MLSRYLEQEEAVKTTLCLLDKSELIIPTDKVSLLKDAVEVLKPFKAATTEMSAEQNLSASKIIPISRGLQKLTSRTTTTLGISLTQQMANRFPAGMEEFPLVAPPTLLDPRFKKVAFSNRNSADKMARVLLSEATALHLPTTT